MTMSKAGRVESKRQPNTTIHSPLFERGAYVSFEESLFQACRTDDPNVSPGAKMIGFLTRLTNEPYVKSLNEIATAIEDVAKANRREVLKTGKVNLNKSMVFTLLGNIRRARENIMGGKDVFLSDAILAVLSDSSRMQLFMKKLGIQDEELIAIATARFPEWNASYIRPQHGRKSGER